MSLADRRDPNAFCTRCKTNNRMHTPECEYFAYLALSHGDETAALREALRRNVIEYGIRPPHAKCRLCGQTWTLAYGESPGQPERHGPRCLAALPIGEPQQEDAKRWMTEQEQYDGLKKLRGPQQKD